MVELSPRSVSTFSSSSVLDLGFWILYIHNIGLTSTSSSIVRVDSF